MAVALAGTALATSAQTARLNAPFEFESVVGYVRDFKVKSNGNVVFFGADDQRAGVVELLTVPALGGAVPVRENGHLRDDSSVIAYQPGPVGPWIVFLADQDTDEVFELYSRRSGDVAPRKLNGDMSEGGDVAALTHGGTAVSGPGAFTLTADGTRVVYLADQDTDEVFELYSVPIDASSSAVRISGPLVSGGDVFAYVVSPTGSRVVYHADQQVDERFELYSAPIDGSASPIRLNAPLPAGGDVDTLRTAKISSNGSTVVYLADQSVNDVDKLFRVPIDGSSGPIQVNGTLVSGGDVYLFDLSPDGARAVYTASQDTAGVREVYSAPLDGSTSPVKLNGALQGGVVVDFVISPDSSRVVFKVGVNVQFQLVFHLQSAPIDGSSGPVLLEDDPNESIVNLQFSQDSSRVVYRTGDFNENNFVARDVRSVLVDGSADPVLLDGPGEREEFGGEVPFAITADSTRVVFSGLTTPGLYSVPIDGSTAPISLASGNLWLYGLDPSGSRTFFLADLTGGFVFELYSVSTQDGSGLVKLSGNLARGSFADVALPGGASASAFELVPAGDRIVHTADANTDGEFELFAGPLDGSAHSRPLHTSGIVNRFRISPDGERVVYTSHPVLDTFGDLYSVAADGGASPARLYDALSAGELVFSDFQVSADSSRVLFRAAPSGPGPSAQLLSVPIAGGTSPVLIEDDVIQFSVSPSTSRVVFLVRTSSPGVVDSLYSAPLDASSAPIQLEPGSVSSSYRVSPDGTRVAYVGGAQYGVYSVPADGSASPVLLSGTTIPLSFLVEISSDGLWVVFGSREAATPDVIELFSARIDGTLGPLKLNGLLASGGDVFTFSETAFHVSPDSTRVVYVADQDTDEVLELFSAPIDGSASPVKLNGPLVSGGDVLVINGRTQFQITPDGSRVVYVADQEVDQTFELYGVPIDGSAVPIKLNGPLVPGEEVLGTLAESSFQITPDSARVVFEVQSGQHHEIFLAPVDGSVAALELSQGIGAFRLTPDSRRVVYLAIERSEVTELFSTVLSFNPKRRHLANPGDHHRP